MERIWSKGRLTVSHTRSRLSAQTIRALLCVGEWSRLDLIDKDILKAVSNLDELEGDDEYEMEKGWDRILGAYEQM